ncbi:hypothetical protein U1Q18_023444 [Sarracenia purpurea var. burkii]
MIRREALIYGRVQIYMEHWVSIDRFCELKVGNTIYPIRCFENSSLTTFREGDLSVGLDNSPSCYSNKEVFGPNLNHQAQQERQASSNIRSLGKIHNEGLNDMAIISQVDESDLEAFPPKVTPMHIEAAASDFHREVLGCEKSPKIHLLHKKCKVVCIGADDAADINFLSKKKKLVVERKGKMVKQKKSGGYDARFVVKSILEAFVDGNYSPSSPTDGLCLGAGSIAIHYGSPLIAME